MRKLLYISLAALTLQTCTGVHAAGSSPAVTTTPPVSVTTPPAPAPAVSASALSQGPEIGIDEQVSRLVSDAARDAQESIGGAIRCQTKNSRWSCRNYADVAIQQAVKCRAHPQAAKNCFNAICTKFKALKNGPHPLNKADSEYFDKLSKLLPLEWEDTKGGKHTYAKSLGCPDAIAGSPVH